MYMPEVGTAMLLVQPDITPSMASSAMIAIGDEYTKIKQADFMTLLQTLAGD